MTRFHQPHWGTRGWVVVLTSILCVAVVLSLILISVINSDQGPLEPTPVPTIGPTEGVATPTTPATPATPGISFDPNPAPAPGSLLHMLGYAPDRLEDGSLPLSDIAQYADLQMWADSRGITIPAGPEDPGWTAWQREVTNLAVPEVLATRGMDPVWTDTYGFGLQHVDQVLAVGSAPDFVLVFRGDFDADTLHASWVDSGYQAVRVEGVTIWSLYPGDSVDLSAPASRLALGNLNNVVLLDDGTLIATSRLSRLEQTVRVVNGQEPSLAEHADVRRLLSPGTQPESYVTAVVQRGTVLEALTLATPASTPMIQAGATPIPEEEWPHANYILTGIQVPTGDADPSMVIVASYEDSADATSALVRAERELATGTSVSTGAPYTDRVRLIGMRVIATDGEQSLLFLHLMPADGLADWRAILEERDYGYIMWPREP